MSLKYLFHQYICFLLTKALSIINNINLFVINEIRFQVNQIPNHIQTD